MKINFPLIYVVWKDHNADGSWADEKDFEHGPSICHSIGWLFKEDEEGLTIISNLADAQISNRQYILKNCITRRTVIRKGSLSKTEVKPDGL